MIRPWMLLTVLLALLAVPSAATAANSAVYDDTVGDAVYPGVDIKRVVLTYSDDGFVGVGVSTNVLIGGNRLAVYLDTDLNAATGWQGADHALFYEQYISGQALLTGAWNGTAWQILAPTTLAYEAGDYAVTMVIHGSEIGSPRTGVEAFARGGHADIVGVGDSYWDTAPNSGRLRLDFAPPSAVGGTGGPAAPTVAPVAPVQGPVAALTLREAKSATRRGLRRKAGRAKLSLRGCRRLSAVRVRCAVTARRGALSWKGRTTVVERADGDRLARSFAFTGTRTDRRCLRRAQAGAARGGCVRRLRW